MADSTLRDAGRKSSHPQKPHKDFPFYAHRVGVWAKKVRGKTRYFGKIAGDPKGEAALEKWLREKDELLAGREPSADPTALTVGEICSRFLEHKLHLRDNGELNPRTYQGYFASCETLIKTFGKGRAVVDLKPDDFRQLRVKLSETRGVVALRNEMQRVRSVFKFAIDERLMLVPVHFGQSFDKPKLDAVRRARELHRNEHGDRMFEAAEVKQILAAAGQPIRAMVLLGLNCAFGQTDLSTLPIRAVDLDGGWINFPRPKTAVPRKCRLWPETVAAIRDWLPHRPEPKDKAHAGLLFVTKYGQPWVKLNTKGTPADALGQEFGKVLVELKLKRDRLAFYALRHTFETVAGETKDQVAVDAIMGHVPQGMSAVYRERIGDDRLIAVTDHVHDWLYGKPESPATPTAKAAKRPAKQRKVKAKPERQGNRRPAERGEATEPFQFRIVG